MRSDEQAQPIWRRRPFSELMSGGTRNGLYKPKKFHGRGAKIVNMGELFAHPRLGDVEMRRIEVDEKELEKFALAPGDLLFARRSLVADGAGKCIVVVDCPEATVFESSIIRVRPDVSVVVPDYLYYLFSSEVGNQIMDTIRKRDAVSGITGSDLVTLEIPVPDLATQKSIASFFASIDNKIANNRALAADLEAMARAIFKSWFVDSDPVKAKMEGRAPVGMDADTAALFPDELIESELGLIPKGWEVATIADLCEIVGGATPSTKNSEYWDEGRNNWATPKDLSALKAPVLWETSRQITDDGLAKISSGLLPEGTVLLSSRAPIGYLAITQVPTAVNQGFIAMKPLSGASSAFLMLWAKTFMNLIVGNANGSTFQEISKKSFRPIPLVRPPANVLSAFSKLASPLFDEIANLDAESARLTDLRDTLLPRLISGKLRLTETESAIAEGET